MKNKGFTVVELLVTIAILGAMVIMVATMSPAVGQRSKLNRIVNKLLADINFAKQQASSENRYIAIGFSVKGTSYTLYRQEDTMNFNSDLGSTDDWTKIKSVSPLEGETFFKSANMTDFAISSTGEVRTLDSEEPTHITLTIFKKKEKYSTNIAYSKKIYIYPYGGIRLEK